MEILENSNKLHELHELHNSKVKDIYKCSFINFINYLSRDGNEYECYLEIPSNQALSGHPEILDW